MFRFAPFSPSATSPNFNGFTLVLPALTLGNVGQLAVDLMLNTLLPHGTELLGYIESSLLLPISGANPFGIEKGGLAASLEGIGLFFVKNNQNPVSLMTFFFF
jgi:proteasome assembly chaperone 2